MKPFTFLLILLALILGLWIAGRYSYDPGPDPDEPAPTARLVQAEPILPERDFGPDGDDDSDAREQAEGLPVPIVPGTRVTEARIEAPDSSGSRPQAPPPVRLAQKAAGTLRSISGRLSATPERASADARLQLEREASEWLAPEVPTNWKAPAHLITRLIRKTEVHPIVKVYGTVYEATVEADFSPQSRSQIVAAHQRVVVGRRLGELGGSLGFILACLASLAGYIRADEATKGYYTAWLRAIAAASVGAAGVLLYQLLT
jgi:hypothetical protein